MVAIRVLYMSTPEFGVPALRLLARDDRFELVGVVTRPDRPAGRGLKVTPPPVKTAAKELGLMVLQPSSLRIDEAQHSIRALDPEVGAVAAYGQWIPEEVFNLPPKRCLNLHPSLLPRHRGAAPVPSAILAGDRQVGLSVLFVEDEMDAGDILAQRAVSIGEQDTAGSLMAKLAGLGAPFFVETLAAWVAGEIVPVPQEHSRSTWFDRMGKTAGCMDWALPAEELARRCRAFAPWPGAFTYFEGKRLLVHGARVCPEAIEIPSGAKPGMVVRVGSKAAVVTGDGLLCLDQVQLAGRRSLEIKVFLNGQRNFVGARLG